MKKISLITLLALWFGCTIAQNIQCEVDSINNTLLLTSQYVSFCNHGIRHTKGDERHSLSLGFYTSPTTSFYLISLPIISDDVKTIKKGSRLKVLVQGNDTISLKCTNDVTSEDRFHEGDHDSWVVLPRYLCSEKVLRRLMDEKVLALFQETTDRKTVKTNSKDFHKWRFSKTLNDLFKEINKNKPEVTGADMLFNNGRYEYIKNDTVVKTQKGLSFSEKWMY